MPDYGILDLNMGYRLQMEKYRIDFRLSVLNILDTFAITDAQSNQFGNSATFNAASSSINFLMGRRWMSSITLTL
jgi:outer membrane receptor protein involved in Fe transport